MPRMNDIFWNETRTKLLENITRMIHFENCKETRTKLFEYNKNDTFSNCNKTRTMLFGT